MSVRLVVGNRTDLIRTAPQGAVPACGSEKELGAWADRQRYVLGVRQAREASFEVHPGFLPNWDAVRIKPLGLKQCDLVDAAARGQAQKDQEPDIGNLPVAEMPQATEVVRLDSHHPARWEPLCSRESTQVLNPAEIERLLRQVWVPDELLGAPGVAVGEDLSNPAQHIFRDAWTLLGRPGHW